VDASHGIRGVVDPPVIAEGTNKSAVITTAFLWALAALPSLRKDGCLARGPAACRRPKAGCFPCSLEK